MKKSVLKKKNLTILKTTEEFEEFLLELDKSWDAKANQLKKDSFSTWVNHYYEYLMADPGPLNGPLFS